MTRHNPTKFFPVLILALLFAVSCQKENMPVDPAEPPAPPIASAEITISSFTLLEDCPEKSNTPTAAEARSAPARAALAVEGSALEPMAGDTEQDQESGYMAFPPHCRQSSMQLAIIGQKQTTAALKISEVRLLGPKGATVGTLQARSPTTWNENRYSSWDQIVMPDTDVSASYKLSSANWSAVEKALGGTSYGPMFRIEVDVQIGDTAKTIRSGQVAREPVEMIET